MPTRTETRPAKTAPGRAAAPAAPAVPAAEPVQRPRLGARPVDRVLLSIDDVTQATGLGRTKVFELIKTGELGSCVVGRRRCVSRRQLDDFVARLEAEADAS